LRDIVKQVEITMSMQGADKHTLLTDRRSTKTAPSHAMALSPAILPTCVNRLGLSNNKTAARGDGESVYAMFASVPAQSHRSKHALTNQMIDRRFAVKDVSDEKLLRCVAEGDKAAMHIIFARHRGRVLRVILRMVRDPSIAEDIANQVFLDVWRSANKFEYRARVSTWLVSIARFKAINSLRERVHESLDQDDVLGIADGGDTPELALGRTEVHGILYACLEKLSPAHRQIIDLFYYRENSVAEVSQIIGISQATAKSRLFYARKQLARILLNAGYEAAAFGMRVNEERAKAIPRILSKFEGTRSAIEAPRSSPIQLR
jgi:RNA polymerase sigma-70 factor (ECF subfamily)